MRHVPANTQVEAESPQNRPAELYEVYLDEATLYFTTHDQDIEFGGVTWLALGITRSPVKTNMETRVDECTVSLDNVSRELSALIAQTDFVGRRLRVRKVFLDLLHDPDHAIVVFDGIMDSPGIDQNTMAVTVRSRLDTLTVEIPRRIYSRQCGWKFGSAECGVDLASVTVTGTVELVSSNGLTITDSTRAEPAGYFADGVLSIGNESRLVVGSDGNELTLEYAFSDAKPGDPYTLRRGCNKSFDESCVGRFDNGDNFGGFLSIPDRGERPS